MESIRLVFLFVAEMIGSVKIDSQFFSTHYLRCANRDEQVGNGYSFSLRNDPQMSKSLSRVPARFVR